MKTIRPSISTSKPVAPPNLEGKHADLLLRKVWRSVGEERFEFAEDVIRVVSDAADGSGGDVKRRDVRVKRWKFAPSRV